MRRKISILGHFGENQVLLNGQTIKTKIIADELQRQLGKEQVLRLDTHGGMKVLVKAPFQTLKALKSSRNVLILPAQNGLRVYAPLLAVQRRFLKDRKLHYAVIGGWLPDFLENRKFLEKQLKTFDGIYVETRNMKQRLDERGFSKVVVMPNCKDLPVLSPEELVQVHQEPYKLCTFSRVMKEKGIEDAVNAVKSVNEKLGRVVYALDIYGQIDPAQTEWFEDLQRQFPEYVRYGGMVPFDRSVQVLKDYFALLFPTYYDGEGFAGTLLDAMSAGLPVIASDWRYNAEIVKDGVTGYLYPTRDQSALEEKLIYVRQNLDAWKDLRFRCLEEAEGYAPKQVIKILIDRL